MRRYAGRTAASTSRPWAGGAAASPTRTRRVAGATLGSPALLWARRWGSSRYGHACAPDAADEAGEREAGDDAPNDDEEDLLDLPLVQRLCRHADLLDIEMERVSYVLFDKPQLLFDTSAAPLLGRPASPQRFLTWMARKRRSQRPAATLTGVAPQSHGEMVNTTLPSTPQLFGSASPVVRAYAVLSAAIQVLPSTATSQRRIRSEWKASATASGDDPGAALATLQRGNDAIRRQKRLHQLSYYRRMILVPKRNLWHAIYVIVWNLWIGIINGLWSLFCYSVRGFVGSPHRLGNVAAVAARAARSGGPLTRAYWTVGGILTGTWRAATFAFLGAAVSPLIHLPCGAVNSWYGMVNSITGGYFFDADCGRWQRSTVVGIGELSGELEVEKRAIRAIGAQEFKRKRMVPEKAWKQRLESMGFSLDSVHENFEKKMAGRRGRASNGSEDKEGARKDTAENPYDVLQVKRSVTPQQLKAQYKKLASVFHPDAVQGAHGGHLSEKEKVAAQRKFESISSAYQILSNPEKKRAYDLGGATALNLHESKIGKFMSGTVEEMIQSMFGGKPFQELITGDLLRSHWHLRNEAQVSVSLHEFEVMQTLRCKKVTLELAKMLDVHAKRKGNTPIARPATGEVASELRHAALKDIGAKSASGSRPSLKMEPRRPYAASASGRSAATPAVEREAVDSPPSPYKLVSGSNEHNTFSQDFVDRCDKLVSRLAEACFGPELLYEVGDAYIVSSQRFLGILPFYAPKLHCWRKVFSGTGRLYDATMKKAKKQDDHAQLMKMIMVEYFSMEFDSLVADFNITIRYAAQNVLNDDGEPKEVLQRRAYAMWLLGEKMKKRGVKWESERRDDVELMAYVQQAANSARTTAKPASF